MYNQTYMLSAQAIENNIRVGRMVDELWINFLLHKYYLLQSLYKLSQKYEPQ